MLSETFTQDFTPTKIEKQIQVENTVSVKLKFDRQAAFRVYDEFTDNITEDSQGNLYVQVDLPDNDILYSYVMSFSDSVEIIEPQSIREQMKKKFQLCGWIFQLISLVFLTRVLLCHLTRRVVVKKNICIIP